MIRHHAVPDDMPQVCEPFYDSLSRKQLFEVRADEGETLLEFHEACVGRGIDLDIRRLSRQ